jgi:hypothetical protein
MPIATATKSPFPHVTPVQLLSAALVWLFQTVPGATDAAEGLLDGLEDGVLEGLLEGEAEGLLDGLEDGKAVGSCSGDCDDSHRKGYMRVRLSEIYR